MALSHKLVICAVGLLIISIFEAWVLTRQQPYKIKYLRTQLGVLLLVVTMAYERCVWNRFSVLVQARSFYNLGIIIKLLLALYLLMAPISFVCFILSVRTNPLLLSYAASFSLGSLFLLTFSMSVADAFFFLYRIISCKKSGSMEFKIRFVVSLLGALFLIITGYAGVNNLAVEHVTVPIKGLDPQLNGTTVVQISDIHLGPFNGKSKLSSVVEVVNQVHGDIVVITGDLVDSSVEALQEAVLPLKRLRAKHGVYFITGNHEYYTGDVDNWLLEIPKLNVTPLINQRVCLPLKRNQSCEGGIYLAGLEDLSTRHMRYGSHNMDIPSALTGRTEGVPTIVLAHQPWAAQEAILWKDVRLVLSGHTHAGQLLPMMAITYLYNPFFVGLYQPQPEVFVYVNPGTVYFFLPFRHYRPEITHITLISQ